MAFSGRGLTSPTWDVPNLPYLDLHVARGASAGQNLVLRGAAVIGIQLGIGTDGTECQKPADYQKPTAFRPDHRAFGTVVYDREQSRIFCNIKPALARYSDGLIRSRFRPRVLKAGN